MIVLDDKYKEILEDKKDDYENELKSIKDVADIINDDIRYMVRHNRGDAIAAYSDLVAALNRNYNRIIKEQACIDSLLHKTEFNK